jgi:hypothetical protein
MIAHHVSFYVDKASAIAIRAIPQTIRNIPFPIRFRTFSLRICEGRVNLVTTGSLISLSSPVGAWIFARLRGFASTYVNVLECCSVRRSFSCM